MSVTLPSILGYSKEKIKSKIDFFQSLGYTKEEIIRIITSLPSILGFTNENLTNKINLFKQIGLEHLIVNDPKRLMQGVELTSARYNYLKEERNIEIDRDNCIQLFIGEKRFAKKYDISKEELLERYPYLEESKTLKKR